MGKMIFGLISPVARSASPSPTNSPSAFMSAIRVSIDDVPVASGSRCTAPRIIGFSDGIFCPFRTAINSPVVGVDGTIYAESSLTAAPPELYAIAPNGTLRWKVSTSYDPGPLALGPDGSIYLGAGAFRAFAPDGTTKWSLNVPDGGAAFWGTVYAAWQSQAEGAILAVGPNGVVNWSVGVAWSAEDALGQDPVAACAIGANGLLYAGQGTLYAVGP